MGTGATEARATISQEYMMIVGGDVGDVLGRVDEAM
jgi:hypothetical protein